MSGYIDKLREHSFDDIQEFDNHLPRWWLWSFYLACIFSGIYWLYYHGFAFGSSSVERFEAQRSALGGGAGITAEELETFVQDPANIAEGKQIYLANCIACHLDKGQGLVGPNLTDNHWIHGDTPTAMLKVILKGGRPNKGMQAWENMLGQIGCQKVLAYILTFKGTNVAGKAPEGVEPK